MKKLNQNSLIDWFSREYAKFKKKLITNRISMFRPIKRMNEIDVINMYASKENIEWSIQTSMVLIKKNLA